jgi:hypothetical protein
MRSKYQARVERIPAFHAGSIKFMVIRFTNTQVRRGMPVVIREILSICESVQLTRTESPVSERLAGGEDRIPEHLLA